MPRTLKKTRIKGLPPRVLLSRRQDATGSFPTVWRTASDNRTGRYSVFYNADKEVPFGYQANPVLANSTSFSTKYEEKEVQLLTPDPPGVIAEVVMFDNPFDAVPVVVITDINHDVNVNAYLTNVTNTGFSVAFSDYWSGSFVYRAFENTDREPRHVLRGPRYPTTYAQVISKTGHMGSSSNNFSFTINNSVDPHIYDVFPTEHYITFIDPTTPNYLADISASATVNGYTVAATATDVADNDYNYIGFKPITAPTGMVYPIMLTPTAISASLSPEDAADMVGELVTPITKQIVASGAMKRGVSDTFVTFTPGQTLQPYKEFDNLEVDAKLTNNPFYASGSVVTVAGEGFQQPLWSKNKIEIDLSPSVSHSIEIKQNTDLDGSYPMAYWNNQTKMFEGLGTGKGMNIYAGNLNGLKGFLEEQTIGFGSSVDNGAILSGFSEGYFNTVGRQVSNFGFPYHSKFQPTSSQQILMSDYISEPFLLEKVVLELNTELLFGVAGAVIPFSTTTAIWSFFILNSRSTILGKTQTQTIEYAISPASNYSAFLTSSTFANTVPDVVDVMQVAVSSSRDTAAYLYQREQVIPKWFYDPLYGNGVSGIPQTFQFCLSSSIKSPIQSIFEFCVFSPRDPITPTGYYLRLANNNIGRNGVTYSDGRDWKSSFEQGLVIGQVSESLELGSPKFNVLQNYTKPNPYILLPTDKLTIGIQLPWDKFGAPLEDPPKAVVDKNSIKFLTDGINKITFYGSTMRVNPETNQLEEYHETLNQLLSSESIHEVITG